MNKKIFFAYESGHQENRDAIKKGIEKFNTHQKTYSASTWENLKVSGRIIDKAIFKAIDKCDIFACDLTYLNHNVLFELGYAIAKSKKLLIFLNPTVNDSKKNYSELKILKNIGYVEFNNANDVHKGLQQRTEVKAILIDEIINVDAIVRDEYEVFLINNSLNSQASLEIDEYIKGSSYKSISSNPSEVQYQTLSWFLKNIISSKIVLVHLVSYDKVDHSKHNCELSFYAGIALGRDKDLMLLAPAPYNAPIDYTDILIEYQDSDDCVLRTISFIESQKRAEQNKTSIVSISHNQTSVAQKELNLLKLGIGFETAEDEEEELLNYYVSIDAYKQAKERKSSFIIGRKGSGKTALFYKIKSELESIKDNYNIIIKPDSEELLNNIELVKLFSNERSKKTFLLTTWKFVLLSKLLIAIHKTLMEKRNVSDIEQKLIDFYNNNERLLALNFYGVLLKIYKNNEEKQKFDDPSLLEDFYAEVYRPLHELLKVFFKDKKYIKLIILADNLDKTWEEKNDLSLQTEMILSLLEFVGKVPVELQNQDIKVSSIILLRKDIFDCIMSASREPDKLTTKTFEINWQNHEIKLREVIERRFRYTLQLDDNDDCVRIWKEYFKLQTSENPFDIIMKIIVPRPRDIIYFVSKLFESAVNNNKQFVQEGDFDYATEAYSNFLHKNLIAELKAEFPEIEHIMNEIQYKYYGYFFDYNKFLSFLDSIGYKERKCIFINTLFKNNYITCVANNKTALRSFNELEDYNSKKKYYFFKKYSVKIMLHPEWMSVKRKSRDLFRLGR